MKTDVSKQLAELRRGLCALGPESLGIKRRQGALRKVGHGRGHASRNRNDPAGLHGKLASALAIRHTEILVYEAAGNAQRSSRLMETTVMPRRFLLVLSLLAGCDGLWSACVSRCPKTVYRIRLRAAMARSVTPSRAV